MAGGTLVFAWGNPGRGDDGLGPEFLARVAALLDESIYGAVVELLADFQLQPEHVTDICHRDLVLFVDASVACAPPFSFARIAVRRDSSFTSHAMSPGALLAAFEQVYARGAPPCYALAIRGHRFELGEASERRRYATSTRRSPLHGHCSRPRFPRSGTGWPTRRSRNPGVYNRRTVAKESEA